MPTGKIKLLNKDYDLRKVHDLELAQIMQELCGEYDMCRHELSTATLDVWNCIIRVAEEIVKRK